MNNLQQAFEENIRTQIQTLLQQKYDKLDWYTDLDEDFYVATIPYKNETLIIKVGKTLSYFGDVLIIGHRKVIYRYNDTSLSSAIPDIAKKIQIIDIYKALNNL